MRIAVAPANTSPSAPVLIFGGSGGIGSALARALVKQGQKVHLVARDEGRLSAMAWEIGADFTVADIGDADAVKKCCEEAAIKGALGGLAYAVGTINLKPFQRLTEADFIRDFRINALGAAAAIQAALPALRAAEGTPSILLFSTVAVAQGFPAHTSVAMAKGAIEGMTRTLAAELAPKIRVNCIAPSLTRTPLAAALTASPQMAEAIAGMHALPRLGEPQDVASLGAYLMSSEASWITGQIIGVDGGRSSVRSRG